MSQTSPRISLPYIQPSQAQKHVTHNEALRVLDAVVQLVVETFDAITPPATPAIGAAFGLGSVPELAWAGQANAIAVWNGTAWDFVHPSVGWVAWNKDEDAQRRFTGTDWVAFGGTPGALDALGVNTSADATNRLAVASDATLLSHDGAGHQLKLNKAADVDTASMLFQSAWVGHAEMGLAGTTDFDIKVSADGAQWQTPLSLAADGSDVTISAGVLTLDGVLAGSAVQAGSEDGTTGRALLAGTSVLASGSTSFGGAVDALTGTRIGGFNDVDNGANDLTGHGGDRYGILIQAQRASGRRHRIYQTLTGQMFHQYETSQGLKPARRVFDDGNVLAEVSLSGGIPTGGVIETGSNANGTFARLADGTQICWMPEESVDANTTIGALFSGQGAAQTFPAPFVSAPVVTVSPVGGAAGLWATAEAVSATGFTAQALSAVSATGVAIQAVAVGRWA